jgi:hypothetical protein
MNKNLSGQDEDQMFGRRAFTENERSVRQLQLSTMIREPEKFMRGEPPPTP